MSRRRAGARRRGRDLAQLSSGTIPENVAGMRTVLCALGAGGLLGTLAVLAISTTTLASSGCGGCGYDDAPVTISPAAPSCLHARATAGWGCNAGRFLDGDNTCSTPLTISQAGTDLAADLTVAPGDSWSVNVPIGAGGPATSFAISLGGQPMTMTVGW
jgi:hypothetical protein